MRLNQLLDKSSGWAWVLAILAGMVSVTLPILGFFKYIPGDLGDTRLNIYFLEHIYQYLAGNTNSYWSAPFMYPEPETISYSDNLLGTSPIYILFRILGCSVYLSFQLWYLTLSLLNFLTAALMFRFLLNDTRAALIGAFIFAFSIALYSQIGHAQTFPRPGIPLVFLFLAKFHQTQSAKHLFLSGLSLVFVFYSGIYLGFLVAIPASIFFIFSLISLIRTKKLQFTGWKKLMKYVSVVAFNMSLLIGMMYPYFGRRIHSSIYLYDSIKHSIPEISSYFKSHYYSFQMDFLTPERTEVSWPHQLFPGFLSLFLLLAGALFFIFRNRKSYLDTNQLLLIKILLLSGILTFMFYLRVDGKSLYQLLFHIPGFSAMRSMTRIMNIEVLFIGFLAAYAAWSGFKKWPGTGNLLFILLIILLAVDNHPRIVKQGRFPAQEMIERENSLDSIFSTIPAGSLISYEPDSLIDPAPYYHLDAMLLSQKYHLSTINAYTATCPSDYSAFWAFLKAKDRNYWLADKKTAFEYLYIIKSRKLLEVVKLSDELKNYGPDQKYQDLLKKTIQKISNDKAWMESVERNAIDKNVSVDSMLIETAVWYLDQTKQKNESRAN